MIRPFRRNGSSPVWGRRPFAAAGPSAGAGHGTSGHTVLELLTVITIFFIVVAAAIPSVTAYVHESRVRGAALYLRSLFRQTRARAAAEARYVGVVFDGSDDPVFTIHADGNYNGIRRADIQQGIDPKLREPYRLTETFPGVYWGTLPAGASAPFFPGLRIGRSQIVSFSPLGQSTSGTLYLSSEYGYLYAVVVLGSTGRVRVARYHGGKWETI
jgi:type II secretory pathway pseudopilin PulG